jgi:RNA polymerase sigma-70 factor, ECF subfamily
MSNCGPDRTYRIVADSVLQASVDVEAAPPPAVLRRRQDMAHARGVPANRDRSLPVASRRQLDPQALGCHIDRLYRAARFMCGSREDAEDLVQETFARVLTKPRILHSDDDLGYLLRVLRNTYVSRRRAAARRPHTMPLPDAPALLEDPSASKPEVSMELIELYEAVTELPDKFRDALVAVDVLGLSYREAADALGTREATVTTRLHRARQRLARQLTV